MSIDYYLKASAVGKPVCFGCGDPDPDSLPSSSWAAVCHFFAALFHSGSLNGQDSYFGVCLNPKGPRHGLLTFEHQAGFGCFAGVEKEAP